MKRSTLFVSLLIATSLEAADLTVPFQSLVSIELRFAGAQFRNSMSLVQPVNAGIAWKMIPDPDDITKTKKLFLNGCQIEPGVEGILPGDVLLSEKISQRGCRVQLDFDATTEQIDKFPAGTVLRFAMCAVVDSVPPVCDYVWSSNRLTNNGTPPYSNDLALDHLMITPVTPAPGYANTIFDLGWEDLPAPSDLDFNDLVARASFQIDSDEDGLWDDWEEFGIDTDGNGTRDYIIPGADKYRKDIYLLLDYMDCNVGKVATDPACPSTHNHALNARAKKRLEDAFLAAPVTNPMGRPPGIVLHIDNGTAVTHSVRANIPGRCSRPPLNVYPNEGNFDMIKAVTFPATDPRRFTHRYGLLAHNLSISLFSGCAELPGNDFIVTLGDQLPVTPARITQQAGVIMHELGHTLGLQHGGDEPVNGKPNYLSVMSYTFQRSGIPQFGGDPIIDYSRGLSLGTPLDELALSEGAGIGLPPASLAMTGFFCVPPNLLTLQFTSRRAGGGIDWNCSGAGPVGHIMGNAAGDINGDRFCVGRGGGALASGVVIDDVPVALGEWVHNGADRECDTAAAFPDIQLRPVGHDQPQMLRDFNDWENLLYAFQLSPDFDQGVHLTGPPDPELDEKTFLKFLAQEPSITITPAVAGSNVTYTMRVTNDSTAMAENVIVTDVLPSQLTFVSCVSSLGACGGAGNNRTIALGSLGGGTTANITLTATVNCVATPTTIVNTASLTSTTPDRIGGNNIASASITATPACSSAALPISINQSVVTFNRATGRYAQTVTLTNVGAALAAVAYVADGLPAGVAMFMPSGVTSTALPAGSPYKELGPIAAGATMTYTIEFTRTGTPAITYVPRLLGPGPR
jgi:uncharacterized repeat protein (TIGR01451 family)